ncbi:unnamed protein product [Cylindrotheca closterium]|uniref:Uncharacterized protein n=1 Tax=Cylindrotheca closterium TaxID=2856 RepID=A0AAD2G873_9STRA|nr:unnamed protein product [Cylindrotheca closterium]
MPFTLFGSNGHEKRHKKSHGKKHNKKHNKKPVQQEKRPKSPGLEKRSYVSERHIDSPRLAARKLLVSIMNDCENGNDDDSFDAPPSMECTDAKARNIVVPECAAYKNVSGSKSIDTDDDMKPILLQMGGDSVAGDGSEAPSMLSSRSGGPPKEIFQETLLQEQTNLEDERSPMVVKKRLSQNEKDESRREEFQTLMAKFKPLDDQDEVRESPAEKERRNIYDMEWFAKVETGMKRRYSNDDNGTPTTHDDSFKSDPDTLPDAPLLSESETSAKSYRKVKTSSESFSSLKNEDIYRQQSSKGAIARSYSDLFQAARAAKPVFEEIMKKIFDHICFENADGMIARFADIKDQERAKEKANGLYSRREPGPALSWLYDIVRGSVVFSSPEGPMRCIEAFQLHPDVNVVNVRNKFMSDGGLDGYEVLNLHLQIDTKKGFRHVCEMQIHQLDVDSLDLEQVDKERLDDLLEDRLSLAQLERLSYLFNDQLRQYDWAEVVLRKLLKVQLDKASLGRLGHGSLQVAETSGRLGTLLQEQLDRPSEALEMLEKELEILKKQLGNHHMKVAETSAQIGDILHAQGETERALEYYGKSVEILQLQEDQKQYSWVNGTREDISSLMSQEEEIRESLEMYSKSLDKYKMTVEEGLSNLHETFDEMHKCASDDNSLDQVIQKNNQSIDECQKTLLEYIPHCHHGLGETTKVQGKVDEVFEVYAKSLIQSYQIRKLQEADGPVKVQVVAKGG